MFRSIDLQLALHRQVELRAEARKLSMPLKPDTTRCAESGHRAVSLRATAA